MERKISISALCAMQVAGLLMVVIFSSGYKKAVNTTTGRLLENARILTNASTPVPINDSDKKFMQEAATGGMMEVEMGKVAEQKGVNPRVRNFGKMMVTDHSKANAELKSIAAAKGVTLKGLSEKDRDMVNKLKQKSGKQFDKEYMNMMVDDHTKDVNEFKKQVGEAHDAEVKAFVQKVLPIITMHLDSAKAIQHELK